ncbi:alanine racemase [Tranquillimonas alkanivorans]|uniref:Alanine racemase n=1 Tax=Tranquillimonas alkanivorans TaxID=441119 RepID=A0A1I5NEP4_9RHOB|nr:alanine racemase [Tranquillimonas alkanivorans]SFP20315.1 alanine racemase [Tranquillimonas alkanivorans]
MGTATLHIDLDALVANWRALDAMSADTVETGAVVKADGYGLGAGRVARALYHAGARRFFIAVAEEAAALREAMGPDPQILVMGGHMPGDTDMINDLHLVPMLNSIEQMTRHFEALPGHPFGIQLDSGMNRLGLEPAEWEAAKPIAMAQGPELIMSHLACADEPESEMNARQLRTFLEMTEGLDVPRSLAATGGILMGPEYHFEVTRPGIGLYGGLPFADAMPVVKLSVPVIQVRDVAPGEPVGYGCTWTADEPTRVATLSAGYGDGVIRLMGNTAVAFADDVPCPLVGRVSMDLITVDITHLPTAPTHLDLLSEYQSVDDLAGAAETIGYEILTALGGSRYRRRYAGR